MATETTPPGQPEAEAIPGVTRYRGKRPIVVEAIEWTGANLAAIRAFAGDDGTSCTSGGDLSVWNNRSRDWKPVLLGHMVVRGPLGMLSEDFFPLPPDLFTSFYEPSASATAPSAPVSEEAVDAALAADIAYHREARQAVWASPSREQVRAMLEGAAAQERSEKEVSRG